MDELQNIQNLIYEVRGVKVMLDKDLAGLYHVTTGNLNKAVKRNAKRFPPDFMFQLNNEEFQKLKENLIFQNGISKPRKPIGFVQPEEDDDCPFTTRSNPLPLLCRKSFTLSQQLRQDSG